MSEFSGHKILSDGTRVPITQEEAKTLWHSVRETEAKRAADMPTTIDALNTMHDAFTRLRKLGWKEGVYCPKDGSAFAVIQYGSTGIFEAFYSGDWPNGFIYCCDGVDHPKGLLFKPIAELTEAERGLLDKCMASESAFLERQIASLIAADCKDQPNDR